MSSLLARTGRHRQRYEDNFRLVSGCIPYRLTKNLQDSPQSETENKMEVLMVSSPNRNDLVFPKGGWEDDETVVEAACREALEEAGVKGILREIPLGVWEFRSKSTMNLCSLEGGCRGYMFALEVTEELEAWPEHESRGRKWLGVSEAFRLCRYEWMRSALEEFLKIIIGEDKKIEIEEIDEASSVLEAECQIMSQNCHLDPPNGQRRLSTSDISPFPWHVALNRLQLS